MKKTTKAVRSEIPLVTWIKLRRLVESGEIPTIKEGIKWAIDEFVDKYFEKGN